MSSLPLNTIYRADIDGLRGIAVASVVLFHANPEWLPGGFVGVDVFFVLSGYLITRLLLVELAHNRFAFRAFLVCRLRRLYPALILVMATCLVATHLLLLPRPAEDAGESIATAALFLSNFLFFTEDGYFEGASHLQPLLHTWSLAIEEQYYVLFPPLLAVLFRRRLVVPAMLASTTGLLVLSQWQVAHAEHAAFFLLPGRAWELLLGGLCAASTTFRPAGGFLNRVDGGAWDRARCRADGLLLRHHPVSRRISATGVPGNGNVHRGWRQRTSRCTDAVIQATSFFRVNQLLTLPLALAHIRVCEACLIEATQRS